MTVVFVCCFCGEAVDQDDPESCLVVVVHGDREQQWWAHRRPCFEAAIVPSARVLGDVSGYWDET